MNGISLHCKKMFTKLAMLCVFIFGDFVFQNVMVHLILFLLQGCIHTQALVLHK